MNKTARGSSLEEMKSNVQRFESILRSLNRISSLDISKLRTVTAALYAKGLLLQETSPPYFEDSQEGELDELVRKLRISFGVFP